MSVIAKMTVRAQRAFGNSKLIEIACVCENDLMAQNNPSLEDVTFSRASPSGDARVHFPSETPFRTEEGLYLIFHRQAERPQFNSAIGWAKVRVASITEFGGTSKQVQLSSEYHDYREQAEAGQITQFNMVISIDNPGASMQFEAGQGGYWVGIYRTDDHTMAQAVLLARCVA